MKKQFSKEEEIVLFAKYNVTLDKVMLMSVKLKSVITLVMLS